MVRYHTSPNGDTAYTAEEETARDAEELAHANGATSRNALAAIQTLEGTMSPRRLREFLSGDAAAVTWWNNQNDLIDIERAKLA